MCAMQDNLGLYRTSTGHALASSDWLDARYLLLQSEYEAMVRWVGIQPHWQVLDAGCGSGNFVPLLAELVGARGKVSAMDLAPENVQTVEARLHQTRLAATVETRVGTLVQLPYADQTFDAVWCSNALQYLTDEELRTAFTEFRRVVRPGGLVAVKEVDGTAGQWSPVPPTLMWHWFEAQVRQNETQMIRSLNTMQLPTWFRGAGLVNIRRKTTLIERVQPLRPIERVQLAEMLKWFASRASVLDLPTGEKQIWQALADVDSPNHILNHPDFYRRELQMVVVGQVHA